MFRMYASNYHSYTHLILALGIVSKPKVWVFITSEYPGIHDIALPNDRSDHAIMWRHTTITWRVTRGMTAPNNPPSSST